MSDIVKNYVLEFPVELVFSAWVSSDTVIAPAEKMEIEPRVGGIYRLIMPGGGQMNGVFSEFSENTHVRYSWQWDGSEEATEIDVTFAGHPDGTEIRLTHSGFQSAESREMHSTGWDSYIDGFKAHLAGV